MTVHTDYREELRLFKNTAARVWFGLLLLLALLVIPAVLERRSKTNRLDQVALLGLELLHADFALSISLFEDLHGRLLRWLQGTDP